MLDDVARLSLELEIDGIGIVELGVRVRCSYTQIW